MKILRLLNKFFIIFITLYFLNQSLLANEPIDIWNIEKKIISNKTKSENNQTDNNKIIQRVKIDKNVENVIVKKELDSSNINFDWFI